jgi:hypothetical protein
VQNNFYKLRRKKQNTVEHLIKHDRI